jgi:hypothetical protein
LSGKDDDRSNNKNITPGGRRFLKLWFLGIILIFLVVGAYLASDIYEDKLSSNSRNTDLMTYNLTEPGLNAQDFNIPSNETPTYVLSGIYVDQIKDISLSDSIWTVDFYIWYKWNGSKVTPGKNLQVINGIVDKTVLMNNYTNGTQHYELYYVTATITKFFDILEFPVDKQHLYIDIEDKNAPRQNLIFVPDDNYSGINPDVQVNGYNISQIHVIEKPHVYQSKFGDPRIGNVSVPFSQLRTGINIYRPNLGFYFRIFIGLFIAVAAALVALFIKPTQAEPRFGLGAGALFVALANNIITSGLIPKTGTLTLADMVNDIGLLLILITIIESTISLYIYDVKGEKKLSRKLDIISFILLLTIYIIINAIIITSAW